MIDETEAVAPLDAYATAKPDEPTFTLQGGDPLAGPLVRVWALLARRRAGLVRFKEDSLAELFEVAIEHDISHDEREVQNLKVRATAAEEVSWAMDAYRKGDHEAAVDKPSEAADTHLDELQRIDLHDLRVRAAGRINNAVGELTEIDEALIASGFTDARTHMILDIIQNLKNLSHAVEPRRSFKKD